MIKENKELNIVGAFPHLSALRVAFGHGIVYRIAVMEHLERKFTFLAREIRKNRICGPTTQGEIPVNFFLSFLFLLCHESDQECGTEQQWETKLWRETLFFQLENQEKGFLKTGQYEKNSIDMIQKKGQANFVYELVKVPDSFPTRYA